MRSWIARQANIAGYEAETTHHRSSLFYRLFIGRARSGQVGIRLFSQSEIRRSKLAAFLFLLPRLFHFEVEHVFLTCNYGGGERRVPQISVFSCDLVLEVGIAVGHA